MWIIVLYEMMWIIVLYEMMWIIVLYEMMWIIVLYEIWINTVEPGRPQMTMWHMRIACWIPKATNTLSE
jgi:hypothetical protein